DVKARGGPGAGPRGSRGHGHARIHRRSLARRGLHRRRPLLGLGGSVVLPAAAVPLLPAPPAAPPHHSAACATRSSRGRRVLVLLPEREGLLSERALLRRGVGEGS